MVLLRPLTDPIQAVGVGEEAEAVVSVDQS